MNWPKNHQVANQLQIGVENTKAYNTVVAGVTLHIWFAVALARSMVAMMTATLVAGTG